MSKETKKYGNWISIKDKLPDIGNCVLVTDGESIEMCSLHETANGMMWYSKLPECYGEILYWQPLPDISAIYQDLYGSREKNGY